MTFTQRPLQEQDDYLDFSKMIEQAYQKRERVANKIPGWVKTGIGCIMKGRMILFLHFLLLWLIL